MFTLHLTQMLYVLYFCYFKSKGAVGSGAAQSDGSSTSVYVSDLNWDTTEEGLAAHFGTVAHVVKAVILRKPRRGKMISKGIGLVEFGSASDAAAAIEKLNGTELDGRNIQCREDRKGTIAVSNSSAEDSSDSPTEKKSRVPVPTVVYVNNLSWNTTNETLSSYFGRAGNVKSAEVKKTKNGRSLGRGIVTFVEAAAAASAVANLNNTELDGRSIIVREFFEN
jgi:nucleolin